MLKQSIYSAFWNTQHRTQDREGRMDGGKKQTIDSTGIIFLFSERKTEDTRD